MQHLAGFFGDKNRHKKKMIDLYESVQHAGNILPRLYLLATVAAAYIKSLEAPAKEILKDVNELLSHWQPPPSSDWHWQGWNPASSCLACFACLLIAPPSRRTSLQSHFLQEGFAQILPA